MADNPKLECGRGEFGRITEFDTELAQCGFDVERATGMTALSGLSTQQIESMITGIYLTAIWGDPDAACLIEFAGSVISTEQRNDPALHADGRKETIGDETIEESLAAFAALREEHPDYNPLPDEIAA